jgi:hypothetical protein
VEGEAILAELDSWAIAQLRKHQLVWSGWGPIQSLSGDHDRIGDTGFGLRKVTNIDGKKLRLFFLSLLWRAAASSHPGFSEVTVETEDLEKLRIMLLAGDAGSPSYFSIQLTQISTLGPSQNLAPLARIKTIPAYEDVPEKLVPYFRFYFDGLAAHIHRQDNDDAKELGAMVVGQTDTLALTTVTYAESFQRKNLGLLMAEAYRDWPELMTKL